MSKKKQDYEFIMRAVTALQNEQKKNMKVPMWFKILDSTLACMFLVSFWSCIGFLIIKIIYG